jgi:alpha-ketoglutarate-dependent taurine dioxygenase
MAYARQWPMVLGFLSVQPAESGGETPLSDSRRVYERIAPEVRARFAQAGVSYVRNYGEGLDLSWQNVFQTTDRAQVESFCRAAGIEFEWKAGDRLRTRQVCQAVARHPRTGEMVWFNQAHLFHVSSLGAEISNSLLAAAGAEPPRNAYFGDGTEIADADLDHIRAAFAAETVAFPWQKDDVLIIDNMLIAHGRRPFTGARKVVVGMGQLCGANQE